MKEVKVVIGANYGDEGKGLMVRHFSQQAKKSGYNPIVIFHNGTAQRGHTVDYSESKKHIYHHFGSGTLDDVPTYFDSTFLIHPMEWCKEINSLQNWMKSAALPKNYCHPCCKVITPFDILVDLSTQEYIEIKSGEREYGSCNYGSWCANERDITVRLIDFMYKDDSIIKEKLMAVWESCLRVIEKRGVDVNILSHELKKYFTDKVNVYQLISIFLVDIKKFMLYNNIVVPSDCMDNFDYLIFEGGQGLGLDKNVDSEWTTTSNTGLNNPLLFLNNKVSSPFNAEVCYVTRTYLTRHGKGQLENEVTKDEINKDMIDKTNVFNDSQGNLRYGFIDKELQEERIMKDFSKVENDSRFKRTLAITHCNEYGYSNVNAKFIKYISENPYEVREMAL